MSLWNIKNKWKTWSTPTKWAVLASFVTVLGFVITGYDKLSDVFLHNEPDLKLSLELQFPFEKINGILKLNRNNPNLIITNGGLKTLAPITVDATMFVLTPSLDKVISSSLLSNPNTGHFIFEPELRPGKSITTSVLGLRNWTQPVVYRVLIEPYASDYKDRPLTRLILVGENINTIEMEGINLSEANVNKIKDAIFVFEKTDNKKILVGNAVLPNTWIFQPVSAVLSSNH